MLDFKSEKCVLIARSNVGKAAEIGMYYLNGAVERVRIQLQTAILDADRRVNGMHRNTGSYP